MKVQIDTTTSTTKIFFEILFNDTFLSFLENSCFHKRRLFPSLQIVYGTLSVSSRVAGSVDRRPRLTMPFSN